MTNCWNWGGGKLHGYGIFYDKDTYAKTGKRYVFAHRYYYEQLVGKIPNSMCVCHKCDNPSCINPDHLFLGTQTDNLRDMTEKGRRRGSPPKGERNGRAKLTQKQVDEIREKYATKETSYRKLGREYGVSRNQIGFIINERNWKL